MPVVFEPVNRETKRCSPAYVPVNKVLFPFQGKDNMLGMSQNRSSLAVFVIKLPFVNVLLDFQLHCLCFVGNDKV